MRSMIAFMRGVLYGLFNVFGMASPVEMRVVDIPVERGLYLDSRACGRSVAYVLKQWLDVK